MTHAELRTLLYRVLKSDKELRQTMSTVWTDQKPTKAGCYWYRNCGKTNARIVRVTQQVVGLMVTNIFGHDMLEDMHGQWSSEPIAEPGEPT